MKFSIKDRITNSILFEVEADSFLRAVESAVKSRADLSGADLSQAVLSGANLSGAVLSRAVLSRAVLSGAVLSGADLSGADLSQAVLSGANLSGAVLSEANLSWADLSGAVLSRANLSRAVLSRANLSRAVLSEADLSRAVLSWANLSWADLSGADLFGAVLSGAKNISPEWYTPLLMLKDQVGPIRSYKLVKPNMEGPYNGGIQYEIGGEYTESNPNTDPQEQCGPGINLATLDWCLKEYRVGYRILIAEFFAEDIAAIPHGTDGKFRVRKCRIVGEKDVKALVATVAKESREGAA